jgi:hypothetical protein
LEGVGGANGGHEDRCDAVLELREEDGLDEVIEEAAEAAILVGEAARHDVADTIEKGPGRSEEDRDIEGVRRDEETVSAAAAARSRRRAIRGVDGPDGAAEDGRGGQCRGLGGGLDETGHGGLERAIEFVLVDLELLGRRPKVCVGEAKHGLCAW